MEMIITDDKPCPEWEEADGTGYCRHCGGQWIVHQPQLDHLFDALKKVTDHLFDALKKVTDL